MVNNDNLNNEEDVKIKFLLPFLQTKGYPSTYCNFNVAIEIQEGRKRKNIFADVVVYTSLAKTAPLIVCETKSPTEVIDHFTRDQAISYARLMPRIAPLVLLTNGTQLQVYQTLNKNRIPELPHRKDLNRDLLNFFVSQEIKEALRAEAKHDLFIIEDVQTFKNVLKSCHNEIRNNEGYDPTIAFDEMSKVLFCKLYEEKRQNGNRFRLSVFDDSLEQLQVNVIRQIFDETKVDPKYSGLFSKDAKIELQDRTIRKIVSLFENYDLSLTAFDVKGEAFEFFLGDTFTGGLGEYFTPRNVVEFIVEAINPKIGDKIVDPFCGTGGFLIYAFEMVSEKIRQQDFSDDEKSHWKEELSNRCLYGTDWKERTSQACKMNMMVHGDGSAGIFKHHGLSDVPGYIEEGIFTICLTNPPFGSVENDPDILKKYDLGAGKRSQTRVILAIERALRLVKPDKWIGIIVIDGILNNMREKPVRDYIKKNAWIRGVISLTQKTFEGYNARAKTSILLLQKKSIPDNGEQDHVFMAVATNTGYAPNGSPIPGNELLDILLAYKAFLNGQLVNQTNAWISTEIGERLDAEYYWQRQIPTINIANIQNDVEKSITDIGQQYAKIKKALENTFANLETHSVRLDEIFEEVTVKEKVEGNRTYRLLGIHGNGGGTFVKEEKKGTEIRAKTLYRVSQGWVMYNRLFAFRGSFAIITKEQDNCYVSGEFPTFKLKPTVKNPHIIARYIVYCLNSSYYRNVAGSKSTGSTKQSRSRFQAPLFLALTVKIPTSPDAIKTILKLLDSADSLHITEQNLIESTKSFRVGLSDLLPYSI